jgi:hypothetical protein
LNFPYFWYNPLDSNDFLFDSGNFLDKFFDSICVEYFLHDSIDNFACGDEDWFLSSNFNKSRNLDQLFNDLFDLINFRYLVVDSDDFVLEYRYFD